MAEINTGGGGGKDKSGKIRSKKSSTKIDMTPMVDLAFLLLTFFMLTTTFSKPQTMEIAMPDKSEIPEDDAPKLRESDAFNIILYKKNKIKWFVGLPTSNPKVGTTDYSKDGIRKLLIEKMKENPKYVFLIKPSDKANYKNVVDILDEMNITKTPRYAIVDIAPEDIGLIEGGTFQ